MRKTDLLWVLAYPLYQTLGTIRHEGSHALAAYLEGGEVTKMVFLPSIHPKYGILWGYVLFKGPVTWLTSAAPYACDVLTFAISFLACKYFLRMPHWLWLNIVVLGILSPFVNTTYAYIRSLWKPYNDVGAILQALPHWSVHVTFTALIVAFFFGLMDILLFSRTTS